MASIPVSSVEVPSTHRQVDPAVVNGLADSMERLGLLQPITVRDYGNGVASLIAGRHRLEAAKKLSWPDIEAVVVTGDEIKCRLIEISENLHRAELTVQERAEQVAEWVKLSDASDEPAQVAQVSNRGGRGKEGGQSKAARDLGLDRTEVRRAMMISNMTPEAKQAAKQAGLADNQTNLMEVARETPERQVSKVKELAAKSARKTNPAARDAGRTGLMDDIERHLQEISRLLSASDSSDCEMIRRKNQPYLDAWFGPDGKLHPRGRTGQASAG